jgi:hypothetical protein
MQEYKCKQGTKPLALVESGFKTKLTILKANPIYSKREMEFGFPSDDEGFYGSVNLRKNL